MTGAMIGSRNSCVKLSMHSMSVLRIWLTTSELACSTKTSGFMRKFRPPKGGNCEAELHGQRQMLSAGPALRFTRSVFVCLCNLFSYSKSTFHEVVWNCCFTYANINNSFMLVEQYIYIYKKKLHNNHGDRRKRKGYSSTGK